MRIQYTNYEGESCVDLETQLTERQIVRRINKSFSDRRKWNFTVKVSGLPILHSIILPKSNRRWDAFNRKWMKWRDSPR